jgi:hypothetical protein
VNIQLLIQNTLAIAGKDLTFSTGAIKGIPGFELQTLYKGEESLYEVERQNFCFHISAADWVASQIDVDMTFTITDLANVYTFNVEGIQPDLNGWAFLKATYRSKVPY